MQCHAEAIKRDASVFFWFSLGCLQLFLAGCILYVAPGSDVNTLLDLDRKEEVNEKKSEGEKRGYNRGCLQKECKANEEWESVLVSASQSAYVCVCLRGPLNSKPFCNPTVQESGEKTPKIPSAINLPPQPHPVCLPHLGKVILSCKTFFISSQSFSPFLHCIFLSVCLVFFPLCHSVSVFLVALCHYYGPICVNANIPFIMGGMVSARARRAHIPHLSHFHHGGIRCAMRSEVRVPDLLSDHWLLWLLC